MRDQIEAFLAGRTYAVAGASTQPEKYGHRIFVALRHSGRETFPLNPHAPEVAGVPAHARLADIPVVPESLSIVTPPAVTRQVVMEAIDVGVRHLWMQPGAEDAVASQLAREAGLTVIDDGSCILVLLAYERR